MLRVRSHILYIPTDRIKLPALLMHNVRHVSEQLIQLPNALLNISYFRFPLYDQ